MLTFLQASCDGDAQTVTSMLDNDPTLILREPSSDLVIESKNTGLKFYAENAASVAAKLNQLEIFKIILASFDKLEQTTEVKAARAEALSYLKLYEQTEDGNDIVIPQAYEDQIRNLIGLLAGNRVCRNDPRGVKGELSAEEALDNFFKMLVPENAIKLQDYLDVQLLLLACYKVYRNSTLGHENNDHFFCVRVIGSIQSVLPLEMIKVLYSGIKNRSLPSDNQEWYRASRDEREGLGVKHFIGIFGDCEFYKYYGGGSALFGKTRMYEHFKKAVLDQHREILQLKSGEATLDFSLRT